MTPYRERFPVGARVRVAPQGRLEQFRRTWRFHNPLTSEQLAFADRESTVREVAFYHGGDALYTLEDVPGLWHEQCILGSEEEGAA